MRFLQWVDVPLHPVAQGRQLLVTGASQVCLLLPSHSLDTSFGKSPPGARAELWHLGAVP